MKEVMAVFSGKCLKGICGESTDRKDFTGEDLFVGDIIMSYCEGEPQGGLTVMVSSEFTTYSSGRIERNFVSNRFPMGIASAWLAEDKRWTVKRLKRWDEVVNGESWKDFGFNYKLFDTSIIEDCPCST